MKKVSTARAGNRVMREFRRRTRNNFPFFPFFFSLLLFLCFWNFEAIFVFRPSAACADLPCVAHSSRVSRGL